MCMKITLNKTVIYNLVCMTIVSGYCRVQRMTGNFHSCFIPSFILTVNVLRHLVDVSCNCQLVNIWKEYKTK